jgi:hypothetical protein
VLGSDQADQGTTSGATATEVSVAQFSQHTDLSVVTDDLNDTLTEIARSAGQILLLNVSQQVVLEVVGPGAVWPQLTAERRQERLAGGGGRRRGLPNKQQEVSNMVQLVPLLQRVPGISPEWMAKELIKRMGDDIDMTEAFAEGVPSMEALNQLMSRPPPGPPGAGQPGQEGEGPGAAGQCRPSGCGTRSAASPQPGKDPSQQGPAGMANAMNGPSTAGSLGPARAAHAGVRRQRQPPRHRRRHAPHEARRRAADAMTDTFAVAKPFALAKPRRPHRACGELNANARITWKIARAIRADWAEGCKLRHIAWWHGVNCGTVHKIVHNKQWIEPHERDRL